MNVQAVQAVAQSRDGALQAYGDGGWGGREERAKGVRSVDYWAVWLSFKVACEMMPLTYTIISACM